MASGMNRGMAYVGYHTSPYDFRLTYGTSVGESPFQRGVFYRRLKTFSGLSVNVELQAISGLGSYFRFHSQNLLGKVLSLEE